MRAIEEENQGYTERVDSEDVESQSLLWLDKKAEWDYMMQKEDKKWKAQKEKEKKEKEKQKKENAKSGKSRFWELCNRTFDF